MFSRFSCQQRVKEAPLARPSAAVARYRNKDGFSAQVVSLTLSQIKLFALRADGGAAAVNTPQATLAMLERHFAELTDVNLADILAEPFDLGQEGLSGCDAAAAVAHLLPQRDADASDPDSSDHAEDTDEADSEGTLLDEEQLGRDVDFVAEMLQMSGQHENAQQATKAIQQRAKKRRCQRRVQLDRARSDGRVESQTGDAATRNPVANATPSTDAGTGARAGVDVMEPSGEGAADVDAVDTDADGDAAAAIAVSDAHSSQPVRGGSEAEFNGSEGGSKLPQQQQDSTLAQTAHTLATEATEVASTDADCGDERDDAVMSGPTDSPPQQRASQQDPADLGCAISLGDCTDSAAPAGSIGAAVCAAGIAAAAAAAAAAVHSATALVAPSDTPSAALSVGLSTAPSLDAAAAVAMLQLGLLPQSQAPTGAATGDLDLSTPRGTALPETDTARSPDPPADVHARDTESRSAAQADADCIGDADMHADADAEGPENLEPSVEPNPAPAADVAISKPVSAPVPQCAAARPAAKPGSTQACIDAQPLVQGPLAEWAAQYVASFGSARAADATVRMHDLRTLMLGACSPLAVLEVAAVRTPSRNAAASDSERRVVLHRRPAFEALLQVRRRMHPSRSYADDVDPRVGPFSTS